MSSESNHIDRDQNYDDLGSCTFEIIDNYISHQRSIYNGLDFLGDVGGLLDGLTAIGGFLMTIFCFIFGNPLDSYLLESLFKTEGKNDEPLESANEHQINKINKRSPFMTRSFLFCRSKAQAKM